MFFQLMWEGSSFVEVMFVARLFVNLAISRESASRAKIRPEKPVLSHWHRAAEPAFYVRGVPKTTSGGLAPAAQSWAAGLDSVAGRPPGGFPSNKRLSRSCVPSDVS